MAEPITATINEAVIAVDPRGGVSPIGTVSPNTGTTAATNSTYGAGAFASGIAVESGTSYTVQDTDYQGIVQFNTSSAIAVNLNSAVKANFTCTILNLGTGAITLTPTLGATVNGAGSLALGVGVGCQVFFANGKWTVFSGATFIPVTPATVAVVAGKYLTGYDATTGLFSENAVAGISGTITLAALTALGIQGSITLVNGLVTAFVQPT
jgi:hypothetical protein